MTKAKQARTSTALTRELQRIGFSHYEARVYLALLRVSPATAYEVSQLAGVPRANAYSVLESLKEKGVVRPVSKSPLRFVPQSPERLFNRIAEETRERCDWLSSELVQVGAAEPSDDYVWPLSGELDVNAKIREMIDCAEKHIWIKGMDRFLLPHHEALETAARRGVQVLIILFGARLQEFQFGGPSRVYLHEGTGIPVGIAHDLITITRDFSEALMAHMAEDCYGSYTRSPPVVTMADTLIRHEIYFAEIFERFGAELTETFGPALIELRRRYLPTEQVASLEHTLAQGAAGEPAASRARGNHHPASAGGGAKHWGTGSDG